MAFARILYCHCAHARVVPERVKNEVLERLAAAGVPFEAVADLCELAAHHDGALRRIAAGSGQLRIAACFPRAVEWLFAAGEASLPEAGSPDAARIANMREETAADVADVLLEGLDGLPADAALAADSGVEES